MRMFSWRWDELERYAVTLCLKFRANPFCNFFYFVNAADFIFYANDKSMIVIEQGLRRSKISKGVNDLIHGRRWEGRIENFSSVVKTKDICSRELDVE